MAALLFANVLIIRYAAQRILVIFCDMQHSE
jgi:hypothetical protein